MSTQIQTLVDYIEENYTEQESAHIYDCVHSLLLQLLNKGAKGVVIANLVAAQLNEHTATIPEDNHIIH